MERERESQEDPWDYGVQLRMKPKVSLSFLLAKCPLRTAAATAIIIIIEIDGQQEMMSWREERAKGKNGGLGAG